MSEPHTPTTDSKAPAGDTGAHASGDSGAQNAGDSTARGSGEAPAGASRRGLIKLAVIGCAGAATGLGAPVLLNKLAGKAPSRTWRFLSGSEAALVEAICEQIIPADQDPGAKDAGVVNFIDKQLVEAYRRYQDKYRKGLAAVQQTSQQMMGKPFEQLAWEEQTKLLQAIESGKVPQGIWTDPPPQFFFGLIRDHTMQGFYGSPRHGGNRNYASYRMLGIEYPRVIGRNVRL